MRFEKTIQLKDGRTCLLRNCTQEDGAAVWDFFRMTHGETDYLLSYPDENSFTVAEEGEFLQKHAESPNSAEIVALVDGEIVGNAGIEPVGAKEKVRHRSDLGITVTKAYWGLGIGRALMESCIACAKQAGYAQLELDAVADNERAIALYQSCGFVEYGRNPRGFRSRITGWQPLVLMYLDLDK